MSKHTPGPWEILNGGDIFSQTGADSGNGCHCDANDGWQVAEVGFYSSSVDGELVELDDEVRRSNMRLIAAAPDLLEALEAFINYDAEKEGDVSLTDCQWIWDKAADAIAKAKGEQQ